MCFSNKNNQALEKVKKPVSEVSRRKVRNQKMQPTRNEVKCMKVNYGLFIREQAIKNLLSAQKKIAVKGDAKGLVLLTEFILKISHQFDNEVLEIGQEIAIDGKAVVQATVKAICDMQREEQRGE